MKIQDLFETGKTSVYIQELPEKYRKLKVLGKGATSIVMDAGDGTVLMFTRDRIKKDWLAGTAGNEAIGSWEETIEGNKYKHPTMGDRDIYVIRLPKLKKLSLENARKIRMEMKNFDSLPRELVNQYLKGTGHTEESIRYAKFSAFRDKYPDSILIPILDFLENYHVKQYGWDLAVRNVMEDEDGKIYIIDPIVERELLADLYKMRRM